MVGTIRSISKLYRNDNRDVHHISYIQYFQPGIRGISTSIPFRAELYFHHKILRLTIKTLKLTIKTYTMREEDDNTIAPISLITWVDDNIRYITRFVRRKVKQ